MLNDAVRGIFDGRQVLGRCFSVYYYYAKHVASERSWRNIFSKYGVMHTAGQIIETFHRLGQHQQVIFITKANDFHTKLRHYPTRFAPNEDVLSFDAPNQGHFKAEPTAPTCNVRVFYNQEMAKEKNSKPVPWDDLDEETQMFYIKKFYKTTKKYIKEYENFVKNLSPNEMIEYLLRRYSLWEGKLRKQRYLELLTGITDEPFPSDTYSLEVSNDEDDSEPEIRDVENKDLFWVRHGKVHLRFKQNPFSVQHQNPQKPAAQSKNSLVRKLRTKKKIELRREKRERNDQLVKQIPEPPVDSDLPSSTDEDDDPQLTRIGKELRDQRKEKRFKKKLRETKRYYYPLEEFYDMSTTGKNSAKTPKESAKNTKMDLRVCKPVTKIKRTLQLKEQIHAFMTSGKAQFFDNKLANPLLNDLVKYFILEVQKRESATSKVSRIRSMNKAKSRRVLLSAKLAKKAKISGVRGPPVEVAGKEQTDPRPSFVLVSSSSNKSIKTETNFGRDSGSKDLSSEFKVPSLKEDKSLMLYEGGRIQSPSVTSDLAEVNLEDYYDPQLFSMDEVAEAELSQFNVELD